MANQEHLDILSRGVEEWNEWRAENPEIRPDLSLRDLSDANLSGANLTQADLSVSAIQKADLRKANLHKATLIRTMGSEANLRGANLSAANLSLADFSQADLREANLIEANLFAANLEQANLSGATLVGANLDRASLMGANLTGANLSVANLRAGNLMEANFTGANLMGAEFTLANLFGANLSNADLRKADLTGSTLVSANLCNANITDCTVYGVSVWNIKLEGTVQENLTITHFSEPAITVDNLEVAQFIYLLLSNQKIRDVIDTITSKAVLILGRFTDERKAVLEALRDELRRRDYLPILFDFDKPSSRDLTETVSTLAHISRFVIADLTDAKSIPQELLLIVPQLPSLPVQPLILSSQSEYAMFEHFRNFPWVLSPFRYDSIQVLLSSLEEKVIGPAEAKAAEIDERRRKFEEGQGM